MPRKFHKNTKRQTPKSRAKQPREMFRHHSDIYTKYPSKEGTDMYRDHGYVPHVDNITESAFDLIKSRRISIR